MNKTELADSVKIAEELSFNKKVMIEEFVEGQEYSVEYIFYKGKHTFLALTEKYTTGAPHFIETAHVEPAQIEPEVLYKIQRVVEHVLDTLMIQNGASHSEIKVQRPQFSRGDC